VQPRSDGQAGLDGQSGLDGQLRALIESGGQQVTFEEIKNRARRPAIGRARLTARRYRMPLSIAAGAVAAAAAAALTLAGTGQLSTTPASGRVVTTATIRHLVSATAAALATSGKVRSVSYDYGNASYLTGKPGHEHGFFGVIISSGTLSFSGRDFNGTALNKTPATHGIPGSSDFSIVRRVHGQEYFFGVGLPCPHCDKSKHHWYHFVGPTTKPDGFADPRGILRALGPRARFVSEGSQQVDGVRTAKLKATRLSALPAVPGILYKTDRVTMLTVWVDSHGVVRRIDLSAREASFPAGGGKPSYPKYLHFTARFDFLDIGVRQHIVPPRHSIRLVTKN
jgi:hypothetical protein